MSQIRLNYEDAYQAVQNFQSGASDIEGAIGRLRSQLDGLRGTWEGTASNDFETLFTEYDKGARQINDTLMELSKALNSWTANVETFEKSAFK
ncbi:MAG: WXG100 family type VII secretion target [Acidimicrobiales bacterium]